MTRRFEKTGRLGGDEGVAETREGYDTSARVALKKKKRNKHIKDYTRM